MHYHTVVSNQKLLDAVVLFPSLSALGVFQGTIVPCQLWKHGSGSYPLYISGETALTSQVLLTELSLLGRCLLVDCWYCGVIEPRVETRRRKRKINGFVAKTLNNFSRGKCCGI